MPKPLVGIPAGLGVPNLCHHCRQGRCRVCCGQPHTGPGQLRWQLGGHHDRPEGPAVHLHGRPCTRIRQTFPSCPGNTHLIPTITLDLLLHLLPLVANQ